MDNKLGHGHLREGAEQKAASISLFDASNRVICGSSELEKIRNVTIKMLQFSNKKVDGESDEGYFQCSYMPE